MFSQFDAQMTHAEMAQMGVLTVLLITMLLAYTILVLILNVHTLGLKGRQYRAALNFSQKKSRGMDAVVEYGLVGQTDLHDSSEEEDEDEVYSKPSTGRGKHRK